LNAGRDMRGVAWRRHRRPLDDEGRQLAGNERPPEAAAVQSEQLSMVREAIGRLRPEEQEVFLLRQDGEMTYEQIAEAIGIPLGTVKTRMRLALERLRKAVEGK
jgi:RNA polymerase sigma-70 factor (ECF subfamily)